MSTQPKEPIFILKEPSKLFRTSIRSSENRWGDWADRIVRHQFDVLGSGPVEVFYGMSCSGFEGRNYTELDLTVDSVLQQMPPAQVRRSAELLKLANHFVSGYQPIDWHIDFKSGYRYELAHHTELKYGLVEGVDAKVSADLSRCYHLVVLALAWRETGDLRYRQEILAQILDWLALNPYEYGAAWRANMNVAIRVTNWVVAFSLIRDSFQAPSEQERVFLAALQNSFVEHRRFIASNLEFPERHIHPNHYVANLAGLLVVSSFCLEWDPEATAWFTLALREMKLELERQILPDGFDYEGATHYLALVLEMVSYALILAAHAQGECHPEAVRSWIEAQLGRNELNKLYKMFAALRDITQPDGRIPLVGDADGGRFLYLETPPDIDPDWRFLSCVGAALFGETALLPERIGPKHWTAAQLLLDVEPHADQSVPPVGAAYRDAGFYVMKGQDFFSLISCGPIGTGGTGGHCHNDKLALTLSIDAQEILVDPGVYVYTASQEYRNLFRSVFSHNTVAIASQEQNRFLDESPWWGCHEDTRCKCLTWHDSPEQAVFVGEHKGYLRLESPVLHRRRIEWKKRNRKLTITDEMVSQKSAELGPSMLWTFMLHPDCHIQSTGEPVAIVEREGIRLEFRASQGQWQVSTGLYSSSYGVKQICPKLVLDFPAGVAGNTVHITW